MEAKMSAGSSRRCGVVSGANRGIGHEICRQLANEGVVVVATARDEKRGMEAVEKLKHSCGEDSIVFHQLDVADEVSISCLVDFVKTKFGKLDILEPETELKSNGVIIQTYELAEQCLNTNYYGTKRMVEAFLPLLQLSHSPKIVNVSSTLGNLKLLPNERARKVLSNGEGLSEERVDEVVKEFLKNCKEGVEEGWARYAPAYKVSKAAVNAYTRVLAKKYPKLCINCVCPGYVKTDMTINSGVLTPMEGAESIVKLALMLDDGPSGLFFSRTNIMAF